MHIDAPALRIQAEGFESALLTQALRLINEFVASVVPCAWVAFGILVCAESALNVLISYFRL